MSAHPTDGGPAFPVPMIPCGRDGDYTSVELPGMSLRDYFAAKALPAVFRDCRYEQTVVRCEWLGLEEDDADNAELIAEQCYIMADAMLLAREAKR